MDCVINYKDYFREVCIGSDQHTLSALIKRTLY